jgi:uncharacterized membrane protein YdjX (TVP38/TMEM64 family)
MNTNITRYFLLSLLIIFMIAVYFSDAHNYLSYEYLKEHRVYLTQQVKRYPIAAPISFIFTYALSTALSIPGGALLSILGGFLFPQPFSTLFVVIGATLGATSIFLIAKTTFRERYQHKSGKQINKMQARFKKNAAGYLLLLRLAPVFPFWLVNLAPTFFKVPLYTFVWTTFVGVIPSSFVLTQTGFGLAAIFESGESFSYGTVFNFQIQIALLALGIFALLLLFIRAWSKQK